MTTSLVKNIPAAISVDVDSLHCYYRAYGINVQDTNIIYQRALPRLIDLLDKYNIKATFFVIAGDLFRNHRNAQIISLIANSRHEIANHTMTHPFRISHASRKAKIREITEAETILSDLIGQSIVGFRSPGWDIDDEMLDILESRGYEYDSSVFPSSLLVLLRCYHRIRNLSGENTTGMGIPWLSVAPTRPYFPAKGKIWKRGTRRLLEIPIGVVPDIRLPFLGTFLFGTGWPIFKISLKWILKRKQPFTFALHPIELLDLYEDRLDPRMRCQPGMSFPLVKKIHLYEKVFSILKMHCSLMTMKQLAARCTIFS